MKKREEKNKDDTKEDEQGKCRISKLISGNIDKEGLSEVEDTTASMKDGETH